MTANDWVWIGGAALYIVVFLWVTFTAVAWLDRREGRRG